MTKYQDRFKVIPAVHLFLFKDNQVLLLRRYNTGYEDGNYSVPAGHADGGERVTEAMIREIKEEIGLDISPANLEVAHVMHRANQGENHERIDFFFMAKNWQGEPQICETDKCDELKWYDTDSLPSNMIPYVKFALEKVLDNQVFSEFGWV